MVKEKVEKEEKEETKETEPEFLVVRDVPTQPVRVFVDEKKKEYSILTIEEALTEILRYVKKFDKVL